jgi:TPR repeat protein
MRPFIAVVCLIFSVALFSFEARAQDNVKLKQDFLEAKEAYQWDYPSYGGDAACFTPSNSNIPSAERFLALAKKGNSVAQCSLGFAYKEGNGENRNYEEAVRWYQKAAEQNNPQAEYYLGELYEWGMGGPTNQSEADKWYRKAAEGGYTYNQFKFRITPEMWQPDSTEKMTTDQIAEVMHLNRTLCDTTEYAGNPPRFDDVRALAEKGDAVAQCTLGFAYSMGYIGDRQDDDTALLWWKKAAGQDNAAAAYMIGNIYHYGSVIGQDYAKSFQWFRRAAEHGNGRAQEIIADAYLVGRNGQEDVDELVLIDERPYYRFVDQNFSEAAKWFKRAASQQEGFNGARFLARSYREGSHGLPKDYIQAYLWRSVDLRLGQMRRSTLDSSDAENARDKKYMDDYADGMTADELATAKRLVREWKPKDEIGEMLGLMPKDNYHWYFFDKCCAN